MERIGIAIDGPAGSGKTTVTKLVAEKLNIYCVDSGAMYRTIAYSLKNKGIDREKFLTLTADEVLNEINQIEVKPIYRDRKQFILLNDVELEDNVLRTEEVSFLASSVAQNKDVRSKVTEICQKVARENEVIMEGRDITTVVMPDAKLKVFLDSDVNVRAERRVNQLKEKGEENVIYDEVLSDMIKRDKQDYENVNSPFAKAKNDKECVVIDTTSMTIEEVVERIIKEYESK